MTSCHLHSSRLIKLLTPKLFPPALKYFSQMVHFGDLPIIFSCSGRLLFGRSSEAARQWNSRSRIWIVTQSCSGGNRRDSSSDKWKGGDQKGGRIGECSNDRSRHFWHPRTSPIIEAFPPNSVPISPAMSMRDNELIGAINPRHKPPLQWLRFSAPS